MTEINFSNPPLNEVVIGLQFNDSQWDLSDFGNYHETIRSRYPNIKAVPPIDLIQSTGLRSYDIASMPRAWYQDEEGHYLIQVQKDRFLLNWRSIQSNQEYPHFNNLFENFKKEWENFSSYYSTKKSSEISPQHYDLTYINHLVKGVHWDKANDLSKYFKHLNFLDQFPCTDALNLIISYLYEGYPIGSTIKKGIQKLDNKEVFVLDFSISEKINAENELAKRIKVANETIVDCFVSLTTELAQREWGKT